MGFTCWTYRRPFSVKGQGFEALIGAGLTDWHTRLMQDGREIARDGTRFLGAQADYRNHRVVHTLPDGAVLEVESGWVNWFTVGIAVRLNGVQVHESHPGRRLAWPLLPGQGPITPEHLQQMQAQQQRDREQWVRNKPSLMVDIALGLLFFVVAKASGSLNVAALTGAAAGLAVVVAQRFVKVDLLGGACPLRRVHPAAVSRLFAVVRGRANGPAQRPHPGGADRRHRPGRCGPQPGALLWCAHGALSAGRRR